jgi:hypothetical protein
MKPGIYDVTLISLICHLIVDKGKIHGRDNLYWDGRLGLSTPYGSISNFKLHPRQPYDPPHRHVGLILTFPKDPL